MLLSNCVNHHSDLNKAEIKVLFMNKNHTQIRAIGLEKSVGKKKTVTRTRQNVPSENY